MFPANYVCEFHSVVGETHLEYILDQLLKVI